MNVVRSYPDPDPARRRAQIAEIVGCRMVGGACVEHQSRQWEPRKSGCPFVDSLMRMGLSGASRDGTPGP